MTRIGISYINKEATQMRKFIALALVAMALVALAATTAVAEGYNQQTSDAATLAKGYGATTGFYTRATGYFSGPHGGYTTTTNKCQDCHSTHYATGSYKLLRADSAAAACDYCHGGGGGSSVNIMMDNEYLNVGDDVSDGVAVTDTTMGKGTGHTLGYQGNAPADIQPAFSAGSDGLACFSCHSPHGNSARIMTTFSDPGRALGKTNAVVKISAGGIGFAVSDDGAINASGEWGIDPDRGNIKWMGDPWKGKDWSTGRPSYDGSSGTATVVGRLLYRPIWPSGRFLLLKNAHGDATELEADTVVGGVASAATAGVNKYKIDWDEPLGPADGGYGGGQDNDNDAAYPFAPQYVDAGGNTQGGFLSLSEFCVDCHDGAAGVSTQSAVVWKPNASDTATGTYMTASSHDAQPRH